MNNNNLIVSILLSILILFAFHFFYEAPHQAQLQHQAIEHRLEKAPQASLAPKEENTRKDRSSLIAENARLPIASPELKGSISLKGGRFDDLTMNNYRVSTDANSENITLLSPSGAAEPATPYYAEIGWLGDNIAVPNASSEWKSDGKILSPDHPVRLTWANGQGLTFERTIALDEHFMFQVTDRVKNDTDKPVTLYPYGLISRHGAPDTSDSVGPLGVFDGKLVETKFKDMVDSKKKTFQSNGGWLGVSDKYWLVALVPAQNEKMSANITYEKGSDTKTVKDMIPGTFQTDFRGLPLTVEAGQIKEHSVLLFAGAKRVRVLDGYADKYDIPRFDRAIDFGLFYFLTKPFLYLLDYLGHWVGHWGIAILLLTVLIRALTYPLSAKSYKSMARMKDIQPEVKKIQERYKDDKQAQGVEMMNLYKREKVNPASGCVPVLIQMPIFFALYKVLYVGIELRHAPFFGWIRDMSAPDPTSVLTFFGALPWDFMPHIGIWPVIMGISMFMQQKLSPQPTDANQARIFLLMPLIFTFMLAPMAAGLVIYWTWSNILGLIQQWAMLVQHGPRK